MKVIYKAPGCAPEPRDIPNTLEELQAAVGGYIETVTFATDAVVICNEEGRLQGLPHNCAFLGVDFVGPILIVGRRGDEFTDLDPDAMGLLLAGVGMMDDYAKIVGRNLHDLRISFGLSKCELARCIGVDSATIRNWENGKYYPISVYLPAIADRFHVSIDYLFGRER